MTLDFLRTLNEKQRQAVEQIYGPVLVLAGPGTGKTHMLTARIMHILQSGVGCEPENILCLTFTESAAVEMRNRLSKHIGPTAYRVKISTFHGFCQWVMDDAPEVFEAKFGDRVLADDLEKALVYQSVIKSKKWEYFSNVWNDLVHQYDVLRSISDLKREHVTPAGLRDLIPDEKERLEAEPSNFYKRKTGSYEAGDFKPAARAKIDAKIGKMMELADLWEVYEAKLAGEGLYDFDDQINWVVSELGSNENLRLDLQERFQWILVDEYQDTNQAQNQIVWALCEGESNPNIFAVGDDDQSIYRFQGASIANITDFQSKFPDRLELSLEENYRSHQGILDVAYRVVTHNLTRANKNASLIARKTDSVSPKPGQIIRAEFSSRYTEINYLIQQIQASIESGVPAKDIAILVRKNREIEELARELPKFGVAVSAQIAKNIFENLSVGHLIRMMEVFDNVGDSEKLFDLLHAPFLDIEPQTLLELSLKTYKDRAHIIESLTSDQGSLEAQNLQSFVQFLITAMRDYRHCRPGVLAEKMFYESGLGDYLTKTQNHEDHQNIRKFIEWIGEQKVNTLSEILERVALHRELDIPIRPDPLPSDKDAVQIMTAHKSKGQEFEVVIIPGVSDKSWGNPRKGRGMALPQLTKTVEMFDENEEERRLFFVALTRAKSQLYITQAQTDFSGREKTPSQFWHELPEDKLTPIADMDQVEDEVGQLLPIFFQQQEKTMTTGERELLAKRVENFTWSASSLQTYLNCPRQFLYQYLYRFPRRPVLQLSQGVALHQALERAFLASSAQRSEANLIAEYKHALKGQPVPKEDFEKLFDHGREILKTYYDQKLQNFESDYPYGYELEYNFSQYHPEIEGIRLTGKVDKVVFLDEGRTQINIVDYKSGAPKSVKKGEAYWRQLVFYSLLVSRSKKLNWQTQSAEIEFLTPGSNGKIGSRSLVITPEDQQVVIEELKGAHTSVMNLEFPMIPNPEGDEQIDFWQNLGR